MATPFQFSLRSILAVMFVVCFASTLVAPFLRALSDASRQAFLIHGFVSATLLGGFFATENFHRNRTIRQHGPVELLIQASPNWRGRIFQALPVLLLVGVVGLQSVFIAEEANSKTRSIGLEFWIAWLVTCHAGGPLMRLWNNLGMFDLEILPAGIVFGGKRFVPWDQVKRYHWRFAKTPILVVTLKFSTWQCRAKQEQTEAIDQILGAHLEGPSFASSIAPPR